MHRARGRKKFEFLRWPFEIPAKQCRPICPHWADRPALLRWKLRRPSWKFKIFSSPGFLQLNLMFWMVEWRGRIFCHSKLKSQRVPFYIVSYTSEVRGGPCNPSYWEDRVWGWLKAVKPWGSLVWQSKRPHWLNGHTCAVKHVTEGWGNFKQDFK